MNANEIQPGEGTQALIFDCDGTLADTMPLHFVAWTETLSRHGLLFSEQRFYATAGMPPFRIIGTLAIEQGISVDARQVAAEKEACYLNLLKSVQPIEPIVELVRQYQGRLPMAVASGSTRAVVKKTLAHLDLTDSFDCHVTSEDTERHKPDPDVFLKAAQLLRVGPDRCRVYEDADSGIEAAQRAGMQYFDVRTIHRPHRRPAS